VQESLANVVKHAPGMHASVDVAVDNGVVDVRIANPTNGTTADANHDQRGMGLRSMRERAESLGGTFTVGPADGRWRVAATIPRELDA